MHAMPCFCATAFLLAAALPCQVTMPPHASISNGSSRGFSFTARSQFLITQLGLPMDAYQAGDRANYLLRINGNVALYSTGNAGSVSTSLLVNAGDIVDVIGNWSPTTPGSTTAHNSMGSAAAYATNIEGVSTPLYCTGWESDIGDPAHTRWSYLPPTTGPIGRVHLWTSPATGFAAATAYGTGCPAARSVAAYESFPTCTFDLGNSSLLFQPNPDGSYTIARGPNQWFTGLTQNLHLSRNSTAHVHLPYPFPHATGVADAVTVSTDGFLWLGNSTDSACCWVTPADFLNGLPRIAACWMDLNPPNGGAIYADIDLNTLEFVVTWSQVPEFAPFGNPVDLQIALQPTGAFEIRFHAPVQNGFHNAITGYSGGGGAADPGSLDLSSVSQAPIVTAPSSRPASMTASGRPVLGTAITLVTGLGTAATSCVVTSVGLTGRPAGIALTPFGAPACSLYLDPVFNQLQVPTQPWVSLSLWVPNLAGLAGRDVYAQSALFAPSSNPLGVVFSNGVHLLLNPM